MKTKELGVNWKPTERLLGARQAGRQAEKTERSGKQIEKHWEASGKQIGDE